MSLNLIILISNHSSKSSSRQKTKVHRLRRTSWIFLTYDDNATPQVTDPKHTRSRCLGDPTVPRRAGIISLGELRLTVLYLTGRKRYIMDFVEVFGALSCMAMTCDFFSCAVDFILSFYCLLLCCFRHYQYQQWPECKVPIVQHALNSVNLFGSKPRFIFGAIQLFHHELVDSCLAPCRLDIGKSLQTLCSKNDHKRGLNLNHLWQFEWIMWQITWFAPLRPNRYWCRM